MGSAHASFEEHRKGQLMPGMLADMAVLSDDLLVVEPERIPEIRVRRTVLGGRGTYEV